MSALAVGMEAELTITVTEDKTAYAWGSGNLKVYSTPHMVGLMESAAVEAVLPHLPEGENVVGTLVNVEHVAPSPIGARVTARARLVAIDGRRLTFSVEARDERGVIGHGTHERVIVQSARFLDKAARRLEGPAPS